jgi:LacI family transcriptional regulator
MLIPDLTNPVFPPIVRGVERTLSANGYITILADSADRQANERSIFETMSNRHIDGLILATAHRKDPLVEECVRQAMPLVLVNRTVDDPEVSAVINDDERGVRLALEHLRGLGHSQIAYVGGPLTTSTGYTRHRAFIDVAREMGLGTRRDLIVNAAAFSDEGGRHALSAIMRSGKPFTAVVAANDLLALGCCDALAERGRRCPDDVSVTGFNDMPFSDRFSPPLTTIHIPHDELGVQAALLLLERIREPESPARTLRLEPRLVARGSTRRRESEVTSTSKTRRPSRSARAAS